MRWSRFRAAGSSLTAEREIDEAIDDITVFDRDATCPPGQEGQAGGPPDQGDELRMLTALRKEYPDSGYALRPSAARSSRGTPSTGW
jgi:hypothetical protein